MTTRVERTDVLVVGSGAREHAYAASLARSPSVGRVYVAPGNGGTAEIAENVPIGVDEFESLARFAKEKRALTVVGPEAPLVAGIRDAFDAEGLPLAGVSKDAAQLEGSKVFAAQINRELDIPQPYSEEFDALEPALAALRGGRFARPVIKADGLAAGKGVVLPETLDEAEAAARAMLGDGCFGDAGRRIVVQERLDGAEFSLMALVDGHDFQTFPIAQDHKRIGEGDTGPNTGGMGAYAPVPEAVIPASVVRQAEASILRPLIDGMARRGAPVQGILFAGLMATAEGPRVIEYNVRGGDPEIPTVLPLLESDLFSHFKAVTEGSLARCPMRFGPSFALTIVLASAGYPGAYVSGKTISGLDRIGDALVCHAGTKRLPGGSLVTAGGRVLDVVAVASDLADAQRKALAAAETIDFEGKQFRRDIGAKALVAEVS